MLEPVGSLLWRSLRVYQVYGANTDVGKTVFTTILCKAANRIWRHGETSFLKPISTGPQDEADDRHIQTFAPGVNHETLVQYELAASPHIAALRSNKPIPSDETLLAKIHRAASHRAARGPGWLFVETAGGVHSPGPSGTTQADLYMPLRLPVVLIGDAKLGGISQTISAFESLKIRGYDVEAVLLFRDQLYKNHLYLADYFRGQHNIPVRSMSEPPKRDENPRTDQESMSQYYDATSRDNTASEILERLDRRHHERIARLESMSREAVNKIWYPFTQQKHLSPDRITVIDSARGDHFQTLAPPPPPPPRQASSPQHPPLLQPSFDGSASWWTQGLGHGNPSLALAAAYAAGRYGHVMFAEAVHEPALALAEALLRGARSGRLARAFFSDNGSTGAEVALKMGLRAARVRYGWAAGERIGVLGLRGGYHGDTIGAMDCAEPGTFNEKVEWYEGKGFWFDYPTVRCAGGRWAVCVPDELKGQLGDGRDHASLSDVFDVEGRERRGEGTEYERYIVNRLERLQAEGQKFGSLIVEPVVLGAGGMVLVDPLFQRTLVNVVRRSPHLFGSTVANEPVHESDWTGLPIIFDEVFTGIFRLGRFTASSFLGVDPDISVHAKLLTGGLVPLCATLASESIFRAFESDDKSDALLHGHSYTAHAVGCQVALQSLREMKRMDEGGDWGWAKRGWQGASSSGQRRDEMKSVVCSDGIADEASLVWSVWSPEFVEWISRQTALVDGVWALGSVLAIEMKSPDGGGYKSNAARDLQAALLRGDGTESSRRWNVHSRVLGNVLYTMASQKTTEDGVKRIEGLLKKAFAESAHVV